MVASETLDIACVVESLSETGCRVSLSAGRLDAGLHVVLTIPGQGIVIDGTIAWGRPGEAGIEFLYGSESRVLGR